MSMVFAAQQFDEIRRPVWIATLVACALIGLAAWLSGFTLTRNSYIVLGVLTAASTFSLRTSSSAWKNRTWLRCSLDAFLLFSIISMLGAVASYVAMKYSTTFTDHLLDRVDRYFGFDWIRLRKIVVENSAILNTLTASYFTHSAFPPVIIGILCVKQQLERLYKFIAAFGLSLTVTVATAFFFPARAAFVYYNDSTRPPNADHFDLAILGITSGSLTSIDLQDLGGIITFPSFHAAMAILFAWALWPFALYRTLTAITCFLMWFSAIPIGGHYAIDLAGGSLIAALAIVAVNPLKRRTNSIARHSVNLRWSRLLGQFDG